MSRKDEIVIVSGARTPMAEYNGVLKDFTLSELGAVAAREALRRAAVDPADVDHTIIGNAMQTSPDAIYCARHVGLKAGVPWEKPAVTVNRLCGSGMESIVQAAHRILLDEAQIVLAGGCESMSQAPFVIRGARSGLRFGNAVLEDSLMVSLMDSYCRLYMAQTAENLAKKFGWTREDQDRFALRSQQLAADAWKNCRLSEEVVPVEIKTRKGTELFKQDDHMRADTTLEGLAALKPAFGKEGTVTAGNASGIVDGGAAVVVTSAAVAADRGLKPLGRLVAWAVAGVEPELMGRGPVPATQQVLKKAGMTLDQIDLIEVNEAFAAQYLGVERELGLDRDKVNVNGGAIALGHPLGASGTRLVMTILYELRRRQKRFGLTTACIGGGQGIALIVESLN
ncbi:MAG: acetyl-CoA C-acetyltransferase [Acidobacteriia bacterium]|nr:acetyl-CoA C-acetyltransferase [Terriglobia bacterium]